MTRAEIEGLCERLILMADQGDFGRPPDPTDVRRRAATALRAMLAREAAMREALRPFARLAEQYDPPEGDDSLPLMQHDGDELNLGHLRDARHLAQGDGE